MIVRYVRHKSLMSASFGSCGGGGGEGLNGEGMGLQGLVSGMHTPSSTPSASAAPRTSAAVL